MYVFSYLELHTTLIAWQLYGIVYDILIGTGLIVLPVLWALVSTSAQKLGADSGEDHETVVVHIKNMVGVIIVILFCAAPLYPVNPTDVKYRPQSVPPGTPSEVNATSDPTTYADHFGRSLAPVRIPAWWGLLHSISAGLTNAVIQSLNTPGDLRDTRMLLESRNIEDPSVAADYNEFLQGCYWRAKDNYQRLAQQGILPRGQDVSWAGSEYLVGMPGGYQLCTDNTNCRWAPASLAVQFSHDPDELARRGLGATCADWWEVIRGQILDQARADQGTFDRIRGSLAGFFSSQTERQRENILIRKTLKNFHVRGGLTAEYGTGVTNNGLLQEGADVIGGVALFKERIDMAVLVNVMKQALPIMTAVTLLFIVMVIPLALLFFGFRIGGVIRLSFLYFSFIFFHALLAFAAWLDHHLTVMLYQGATQSLGDWFFTQGHLGGNTQKEWLIDIVLMGFYIIMPLLWFGLMGAIGVGAAAGMDGLIGGSATSRALSSTTRGSAGSARGAAYTKGKAAVGKVSQRAKRWKRPNAE